MARSQFQFGGALRRVQHQATIQGLVNPVLVADGKFTLGGAVLGGSYATCRVPTPAEGCIGSHYRMCWAHGVYQAWKLRATCPPPLGPIWTHLDPFGPILSGWRQLRGGAGHLQHERAVRDLPGGLHHGLHLQLHPLWVHVGAHQPGGDPGYGQLLRRRHCSVRLCGAAEPGTL